MSPEQVSGFANYTPELIHMLRGRFAYEQIDSRPIKYNDVIIWLNADQKIHRHLYPAVERSDGSMEFWENGIQKHQGE